ncbi:MAG: tetratricopeptide repeat protein [bacterium]|nr:tetratricopeptide repeat protein [bacterium]
MKKDQLAFLLGGLTFGILIGVGLFNAISAEPALDATPQNAPVAAPAGQVPRTQVGPSGADGGAPMVREINELKRRLQQDPDDLALLTRLAGIYFDVSMWEQARGYYERAIEIAPADPDLMTDLGTCYRGIRQYDKAVELFEQAHEIDPQHWQSLFNLAVVAVFNTEDYERAQDAVAALEAMNAPAQNLPQLRQALADRLSAPASGGSS